MISAPRAAVSQWPGGLEEVARCPLCGEVESKRELDNVRDDSFGTAPGAWGLKRCVQCSVVYLDPRPDAASIHLAYRDYYTHAPHCDSDATSAFERLRKALGNGYRNWVFGTDLEPALAVGRFLVPLLFPLRAARIRAEDRMLGSVRGARRSVLDVGCGNGEFLHWARRLGWNCYGVELDPEAAAVARARGAEILGSELRELSAAHDGFFDAITLSHVIEHLHDPLAALRHCWRVLKPGGLLWIETPNIDSVGYEIYGRHWRGLEAPRHLVLFNTSALRSSLERVGFERIRFLPSRDVAGELFLMSEAMRLGFIGERGMTPLPKDRLESVSAAVRTARAVVRRNPARSEFLSAVAHRPPAPRS
jgi:SAM-dependent methyltransferase